MAFTAFRCTSRKCARRSGEVVGAGVDFRFAVLRPRDRLALADVVRLGQGRGAAEIAGCRVFACWIAQKNRLLVGEKSERRGRVEHDASPKPPQKGHGPKAQPSLLIVELVHGLDEADKVCSSCGGALEAWEGQFEESEEVDVVPRRFEFKKHKRQKYRCRCDGRQARRGWAWRYG
ncbi:IS66 family transposase zinc-finger binding domain-containing protein [Polyangium mundeleinium]|uniref:IS66 family transposase zinc-finger binding domain-containing protein n=1 Tax=Polyangium mundeleinium TaxID=2995306 RepID=A0ABT5EGB2_9BACT|nr:IS66 family transposase zinc-finger binding domain-containing protein [Polyangium mundeleinium]MDC0740811.1 IS66 family transposase zinc-finger binding domain-containing protein [Polyangium mundeleinium]